MTRLAQAFRWWRNRRCECSGDLRCSRSHARFIRRPSIPDRHFGVLLRAGWLRSYGGHPVRYRLEPPAIGSP